MHFILLLCVGRMLGRGVFKIGLCLKKLRLVKGRLLVVAAMVVVGLTSR